MKDSEYFGIKADEATNDMAAFNYAVKAERAKRAESFEESILPEISQNALIGEVITGDYHFRFILKDGRTFDLYPRKNRLFEKKGGKWHNNGITKLKVILGV